jgi:uncharacterized protein
MVQIAHRTALWLLRAYKRFISPMVLPACRYTPTCSEYAMEAIANYGVVRGGAMTIWRLLRCHPLAKGGIDLAVKPSSRDTQINPGLCSH